MQHHSPLKIIPDYTEWRIRVLLILSGAHNKLWRSIGLCTVCGPILWYMSHLKSLPEWRAMCCRYLPYLAISLWALIGASSSSGTKLLILCTELSHLSVHMYNFGEWEMLFHFYIVGMAVEQTMSAPLLQSHVLCLWSNVPSLFLLLFSLFFYDCHLLVSSSLLLNHLL